MILAEFVKRRQLAQGIEIGMERGMERGIEQGIERGVKKGAKRRAGAPRQDYARVGGKERDSRRKPAQVRRAGG